MPTVELLSTLIDVDCRYGAVDIGGTKIAVGLVAADGRVVFARECPTAPSLGPDDAFERIVTLLSEAQVDSGQRFEAIGVGCTGPVDPVKGIIGDVALLPGWNGFPLTQRLEQRFQVPVCLENDCDVAALGEFSATPESLRFLYVSISTGIGAGLILDGRVYRGIGGAHPELGHHAIDPAGPACYCGAKGCWESLASGTAIAHWYATQSGAAPASSQDIFRRVAEGEKLATEAVERFTQYFAMGLGNLITIFAPDTIAVGGGVMSSASLFFNRAVAIARSRAGLVPAHSVEIRPATFGSQAGLIGAAQAARRTQQTLEGKLCTQV